MGNAMLEVFTLGKFLVRKEDEILSEHQSHASKLWELFQYFLSKTSETLPPDQIIKDLDFDMELLDSKNTLENRIFRLRKLLAAGEEYRADKYIYFRNGGYGLRWKKSCWVDFMAFQEGCEKGERLARSGKKMDSLDCILPALDLYQGDYLNNNANTHWAVPPRVQYRQLYLESFNLACDLLADYQEFQKIEDLCQRAVQIEPFEERPHYILIETLLKRGHKRKARQHYNFVQTLFAEQGVDPFPELGKTLLDGESSFPRSTRGVYNLDQIKKEINLNNSPNGIKIVPPHLCRYFAETLYRRCQRENEKLYLASVALEFCHSNFTEEEENRHISSLQQTFQESLRNCDIICEWTGQQYLILLSSIKERKVLDILERIKDKYHAGEEHTGTIINTSYRII